MSSVEIEVIADMFQVPSLFEVKPEDPPVQWLAEATISYSMVIFCIHDFFFTFV